MIMRKTFILLFLILIFSITFSVTLIDGFEDGDADQTPTWSDFTGNVNGNQTHSGSYSIESNSSNSFYVTFDNSTDLETDFNAWVYPDTSAMAMEYSLTYAGGNFNGIKYDSNGDMCGGGDCYSFRYWDNGLSDYIDLYSCMQYDDMFMNWSNICETNWFNLRIVYDKSNTEFDYYIYNYGLSTLGSSLNVDAPTDFSGNDINRIGFTDPSTMFGIVNWYIDDVTYIGEEAPTFSLDANYTYSLNKNDFNIELFDNSTTSNFTITDWNYTVFGSISKTAIGEDVNINVAGGDWDNATTICHDINGYVTSSPSYIASDQICNVYSYIDFNKPYVYTDYQENEWHSTSKDVNLFCSDDRWDCSNIIYRVNGGSWIDFYDTELTNAGNNLVYKTITINTDGNNLIEYYGIDWNGYSDSNNYSDVNSFYVAITDFDANFYFTQASFVLNLFNSSIGTLFTPSFFQWDINSVFKSNDENYVFVATDSNYYNVCLTTSDNSLLDYNVIDQKCEIIGLDGEDPITDTNFNDSITYSSPQQVDLNCNDVGIGTCQTTYYKINNGSLQTGNSFIVDGGGKHTVEYYSVDDYGNIESSNFLYFDINAFTFDFNVEDGLLKLYSYFNYDSTSEFPNDFNWYLNGELLSQDVNAVFSNLEDATDYNLMLINNYTADSYFLASGSSRDISNTSEKLLSQSFIVDNNRIEKVYFKPSGTLSVGNVIFRIVEDSAGSPDNNYYDQNNSNLFYKIITPEDWVNTNDLGELIIDVGIDVVADNNYWIQFEETEPLYDDAELVSQNIDFEGLQTSYDAEVYSLDYNGWVLLSNEIISQRMYFKIVNDERETSFWQIVNYVDEVAPEEPTISPNDGNYAGFIQLNFSAVDDLQDIVYYYCDVNSGSGFERLSDVNGITSDNYLLNVSSYPIQTQMNWRCKASDGFNDSNYTVSTEYIIVNPDTNAPTLSNFVPTSNISTTSAVLSFFVDAIDDETSVDYCNAKVYKNGVYIKDINSENIYGNTFKALYDEQASGDSVYVNWYCADTEDNISPLYSTYKYFYTKGVVGGSGGAGGGSSIVKVPTIDFNFSPKEISRYWWYFPNKDNSEKSIEYEVLANQEIVNCFAEDTNDFECRVEDGFRMLITIKNSGDDYFSLIKSSRIFVENSLGQIGAMNVSVTIFNLGYYELLPQTFVLGSVEQASQLDLLFKSDQEKIIGFKVIPFVALITIVILISIVFIIWNTRSKR